MNPDLLKKLGDRLDLYPHQLEASFPHVLRRVVELWGTAELDRFFASLVYSDDVPRQGFPLIAANEIAALEAFYRAAREGASSADRWAEAPDVKRSGDRHGEDT